jgi:hypothetical protein
VDQSCGVYQLCTCPIIKKRKAKDCEITDKEGIKDGKIVEGIDKIVMANLTEILIIEIVEIGNEAI